VKRLALICLLALPSVAGVAYASSAGPNPNDGTLTIKAGIGRFVVEGKGVLIGRFDKGQITIKDPNPNDGPAPIVAGAEATHDINDTTTRYSGNGLAFRIIGGKFSVTVVANNVELAVKGKATVTLTGKGTADDGSFSVNDGTPQDIPAFPLRFLLTAPVPQPTPGG
jgi:subtilisin family serine protease